MKANYRKAFEQLKKMGVPVYVHVDHEDRFDISAEESNSGKWVCYPSWNPHLSWEFGIHPDVNTILHKHGLYAEWVNPAQARVYDA